MRRRRRLVLRAGAVACGIAAGALWWPTSAGAQSGAGEVGWWYRYTGADGAASGSGSPGSGSPPPSAPPAPAPFPTIPVPTDEVPGAPAPVPPPATVPDGGFYVANDSFGPLAMAAVRFHVGQVGESRLTVQFAEGGASGGMLPIVACPLLEGFQPVANGSWRDRPAHDCERAQALGTIGSDGALSFTLSAAFQQAGQETLDVVLLPEPGNGTPFSSPFQPVDASSLAVNGAPPSRPLPTTAPSFVPDPDAPAASFTDTAAPRRVPGGTATPRPAGGGATPRPAGGGGGSASPAPSAGGSVQQVASVLDDAPSWARLAATVLLGILAVALAAATNDRVRAAVPALDRLAGAGAAGAATERGVGRFARTRDGRPPALT
jgi:hypothetical protein